MACYMCVLAGGVPDSLFYGAACFSETWYRMKMMSQVYLYCSRVGPSRIG